MKNNSAAFRRTRAAAILGVILAFILSLSPVKAAAFAASDGGAAYETERIIDDIIACEAKRSGAASAQEWLDGALTDGAGRTSDWFVLALSRYREGLDLSSYADALEARLGSGEALGAAESRRCALLLIACGRADSPHVADVTADEPGIMSLIFELHLANNGAASAGRGAAEIAGALLSLRLEDGGWALGGALGGGALGGGASDVDVTAMTVQALAPFYGSDPYVSAAIDSALDLLGARQLESGAYRSFGAENPESAAQVILALASLGLDPAAEARFNKNGVGLLDGMLSFRLEDGGFCHTLGGGYNATATAQALYSLVALWRMQTGRTPLYIFDSEEPSAPPDTVTAAETDPQTSKEGSAAAETDPQTSNEGSAAETVPQTSNEGSAAAETDPQTSKEGSAAGDTQKKHGYKPWACLAVILSALAAGALLFFLGKGNRRNFIFVGVIAALLLCVLLFTDIKSPEAYYGTQDAVTPASDSALGVTLTIRCDRAVGKVKSEYIPADGVILPVTAFTVREGDTVYDLLLAAAREYGLQLESNGMQYIEGINYLYEFDCGELSGWQYRVNGEVPSVGCGSCRLRDGDSVEWLYTCELGRDLD